MTSISSITQQRIAEEARRRAERQERAREARRQARLEAQQNRKSEQSRPKVDGTRVNYNGKTTDAYTKELALRAEKIYGGKFTVSQGSYNPGGVAASAGTHDGGGALDLSIRGKSSAEIKKMVEALRKAGFAAWYRSGGSWAGNEHIHAIAIGAPNLSPVAKDQVISYANGGDGLAGNAPDPQGYLGRPMPEWARKLVGASKEDLFPTDGTPIQAPSGVASSSGVGGSSSSYGGSSTSSASDVKLGATTGTRPNDLGGSDAAFDKWFNSYFEQLLAKVEEEGPLKDDPEFQKWKKSHPNGTKKDFLRQKLSTLQEKTPGFDLERIGEQLERGRGKRALAKIAEALRMDDVRGYQLGGIDERV